MAAGKFLESCWVDKILINVDRILINVDRILINDRKMFNKTSGSQLVIGREYVAAGEFLVSCWVD